MSSTVLEPRTDVAAAVTGGPAGAVASAGPTGPAGPATPWVDNWAARGRCRTVDPDALFVQGAAQNRAKLVCTGCPVRTECLADALDNRTEFGVWGGMTERERRALLRRRPDVGSWRRLLESAREDALSGRLLEHRGLSHAS